MQGTTPRRRRCCPRRKVESASLLLILMLCFVAGCHSTSTTDAQTGDTEPSQRHTLPGEIESRQTPDIMPAQPPSTPANPNASAPAKAPADVEAPRTGSTAPSPTSPNTSAKPDSDGDTLRTFVDGVRFVPNGRLVEVDGFVCLDIGWLEQIACSPNTREHEALVVIPAKPSAIHAALLAAGFESGTPGRWSYPNNEFRFVAPTGDAVDVFVRYADANGAEVTHAIRRWIIDHEGRFEFPDTPWIFGGSRLTAPDSPNKPGEHYMADTTGSIIGLVTFGDELIGLQEVIADQSAVHAPQWVVATDRMPSIGTEVTLIIKPYGDS
jgi:hypothetical protein